MSGEEQLDQLNVQRSTYTYPAEDDGGDVSIPVHITALLTSAIKKQSNTSSSSKHVQWAEAMNDNTESTTSDEPAAKRATARNQRRMRQYQKSRR